MLPLTLILTPPALAAPAAVAQKPDGADPFPGVPPHPLTMADFGPGLAEAYDRIGRAIAWFEIAFPDLRLQTRPHLGSIDVLVFSWPVFLFSRVVGKRDSAAGLALFLEPQLPTHHAEVRGLVGLRVFGVAHAFGAVIEGGGLAATDGHGAFLGGGPAIGEAGGMVAAVARRYFVVSGEDRWDFTIELSMPTRPLWVLLGL